MSNASIFCRIIGARGGFAILLNHFQKSGTISIWDRSLHKYLNHRKDSQKKIHLVSKIGNEYNIKKRESIIQKETNNKIENFIFTIRETDIEKGVVEYKKEIERSDRVLFFSSNVFWLDQYVKNKSFYHRVAGCFVYLGGSYCLSHELYSIFPGKLIFITSDHFRKNNANIEILQHQLPEVEIIAIDTFIKKYAFSRIMLNILSLVSTKFNKNMGQLLNDQAFILSMNEISNCLAEILSSNESFDSLKSRFIEDYYEYYSSYYLTKFLRNKEKNDFSYIREDLLCLTSMLEKEAHYHKITQLIEEVI